MNRKLSYPAALIFACVCLSGCPLVKATGDTVERTGEGAAHAVSETGRGIGHAVEGTGDAIGSAGRDLANP